MPNLDQALARALQASGAVRRGNAAIGGAMGGAMGGATVSSSRDAELERALTEMGDPEVDNIQTASAPPPPYVPPNAIARQYRMADALRNQPTAREPYGVIAQGLGAIGGNIYEGSANRALAANDQATLDTIRRAGGAGNSSMMAKMLLNSNDPALARTGLSMLAKSDDSAAVADLRRAQAAEATAKAGYYNRDRGGYSGLEGARWENLIQRAAKEDPEFFDNPLGTLEKYREAYQGARGAYGRPAAPTTGGQSTPGDAQMRLNQAREAISQGAPRDQVIRTLQSLGIDPAGL